MPKPAGEPQVKGPEMNDRDRINDILATVKHMTNGFNVGLNEMQNPRLRQVVQKVLNETQQAQAQIFDQMFANGWYKMKVADQQEIDAAHKQFVNYRTQIPQF
jgi:spore coat protein CotF